MSAIKKTKSPKNTDVSHRHAQPLRAVSKTENDHSPVIHEHQTAQDIAGGSNYRVLVPIANSTSVEGLITPAANAALRNRGKILMLHVILVPASENLVASEDQLLEARKLMDQAGRVAQNFGVEIDTQVRVAHRLSEAIIQTSRSKGIDLTVLGWRKDQTTGQAAIGTDVDYIIAELNCHVMIIKQQVPPPYERILLPIADLKQVEPLLNQAALLIDKDFELEVIHYFTPGKSKRKRKAFMHRLNKAVNDVRDAFPQLGQMISVKEELTPDIVGSIVEASNYYDAVVIGATRASWIKRRFQFDKPNRIALRISKPLILISPQGSRVTHFFRRLFRSSRSFYFKMIRWIKGLMNEQYPNH